MSVPALSRHRQGTAPTTRMPVVLASLAILVALWLGLTAPSVSPVAPAPLPRTVRVTTNPGP